MLEYNVHPGKNIINLNITDIYEANIGSGKIKVHLIQSSIYNYL